MTFLEQIEDFLLQLRDSYGFILPVDRLRMCLCCVEDITDVEEVLFRLQSMVCGSEEQVETFQSVFAQRFLMMRPQVPNRGDGNRNGRGQGQKKQETPADIMNRLQNAVNRTSANLEQANRELDQASQDVESAREKMQRKQEEYDHAVQNPPGFSRAEVSDMRDRLVPNGENPKLQKALEKLNAAFDGMDQNGVPSGEYRDRVQKALASPDYGDLLEKLKGDLMALSRKTRGKGNGGGFGATLKGVTALKELKSAATRSVSASGKKEYNEAAKTLKKHEAILGEHKEEMKGLERELDLAKTRQSRALNRQQNQERQKQEADSRLEEFRKEQERLEEERRREEERQRLQNEGRVLIKERAVSHRPLFVRGINAVQTTAEQAELMKTDLRRMSAQEKDKVLTFIRTNARAFRQTLRRRQAAPHHRRVDLRATIRAASRTGGEPIVIRYREPKKSHAKVVILTDISGSCRNASTLALYFMGLMDEAFPGGCRKFAFVNTLNPVDHCFRDRGPDEGVQAVLDTIPTRGVYSDYGTTIRALREEYGGTFHKDTTVIILGDARNNRRYSASEDLKYIADRCCRMYWLNTDDVSEWNRGDSIIGEYESCGAEVHHVSTVGELLEFLSGVTAVRGTA